MKRLLKKFYFIGILCCASCDYLDIVPDDVPTLDNAFNMRSAAETYLFTCYSWLPSHADIFGNNPAFMGGDEIWTTHQSTTFGSNFNPWQIALGNQNVSNPITDYWTGAYGSRPLWRGIRECNIFLENIGGVDDMTDFEKDLWSAEVKFLKAYYHFWLLRMYGPIPIINDNMAISATVEEVRSVLRQPVDDVVSYIVGLLDEAALDLPDTRAFEVQEQGRITKPIALTLRAVVLMTAASPLFNGNPDYQNYRGQNDEPYFSEAVDVQKWALAAQACKTAIDLCHELGMELYYFAPTSVSYDISDTTQIELNIRNAITERWNSEIIWGNTNSRPNAMQRESQPTLYSTLNLDGSRMAPPLKMAELFYTENGVPITEDRTWNYANRYALRTATYADRHYLQEGQEVPQLHFAREPRFYASLGFDRGRWYGHGRFNDYDEQIYIQARAGDVANNHVYYYSATGYWPKKVVNYLNVATPNQYTIQPYPWPVMRLTELYLLYAEALNEIDGPTAEVFEYLDLVRERAGLKGVEESWTTYSTNTTRHTTQSGMREIIHQERLIELAFEGHRFWDLRRWKKASQELSKPIMGWDIMQEDAATYYRPRLLYDQQFRTRDYFWPIRESELLINKNLQQSPGW